MSFDTLGDLNWAAVIVAAVVYFILGAVWYAPPLFGKAWMRSIGWDESNPPPAMNPAAYAGPLAAYVVAAIAVGMLAAGSGTDTAGEGATLGLVLAIGVNAMLMFVTGIFEPNKPKPMTWAAITGAYHATGLFVAALLIGAWT